MLRGTGRYIRQHHVALLALFVALGGTALALDRNQVKSRHIAPGEVKLSDTNDKLRLKCPGGTRYHEGACIEAQARGSTDYAAAESDCVDDNRRLPDSAELLSFRHEPGVTLTSEWASPHEISGGSEFGGTVTETSRVGYQPISTSRDYRCVARPKR